MVCGASATDFIVVPDVGTLGVVTGVDVVVVWLGVTGTCDPLVISQSSQCWTTLPESLQ